MRIPEPGDVLAEKYRLDEVLGEGGFGVVMRGTTAGTGRPVAVKILKPKSGGYEVSRATRFLREMATIAKLQSPQTLTLYDYGRTDDGVLFMVTEFVDGEDLFALMSRRGRLEEHEVVWILYQVLQSLAEAHELGVLHRDIKPSNIRLFEYERDPLRVKVLDFGLAKAIEPGTQANLTATNKVIGTPRYMAPEQIIGEKLTPATDLYALGILAAEMLIGRTAPAFEEFRPGRPLFLSPGDDVTDALRAVVNQLLEPNVDRRFANTTEVLAALRPLRRRGPLPRSRAMPAVAVAPEPPTIHVEQAPPRPPRPTSTATIQPDRARLVVIAGALILISSLAAAVATHMAVGQEVVDSPPVNRRIPNALVRSSERPAAETESQTEPVAVVVPGGSAGCGGQPHSGSRAAVYAPTSYDSARAYPAIVWLMADQDDPDRVPQSEPFRRLVEEEEVLVVVPYGASRGDWRADQAETLREAVEDAGARYCVKLDSVYVMSQGGAGHLALAVSCDTWVSGVAIGSYSRRDSPLAACVPTVWFSAADSNYLPIRGGRSCAPLPGAENVRSLEEIETELHGLAGCSGPPRAVADNEVCRTWECRTPLQSCVLPGGFGWPGTKAPAAVELANFIGCKEPPPSDFDAVAYAWRFLNAK